MIPHLTVGARPEPLGDALRASVLWMNGRDRVRQTQNVTRIIPHATRCFGRKTLAPNSGIERIAKLTLERQRDASGRLPISKPTSADPILGRRGFDNKVHQAATPDQRSVRLTQDSKIPKRELLIAFESGLQP